MNLELSKTTFDALSEFARNRLCLIDEGTGNLLFCKNRLFIATCHHVAEEFFKEKKYRFAVLRNNVKIEKQCLELVAYKDGEIDVALIEVHAPPADYHAYEFDNLENIDSFSASDFDNCSIMISGHPTEKSRDYSKLGTEYTQVSYMTIADEAKLPCSDFLYCKYTISKDGIDNKSDRKVKLPAAGGFSGAFMLKLKRNATPQQSIWTPNTLRVVAIQHRWDKKTYIKGTNVKYLVQLLQECGAA